MFEDYLKDQFMKEYTFTKDEFNDRFDDWLSNFTDKDWIDYANDFQEYSLNKVLNTINSILKLQKS